MKVARSALKLGVVARNVRFNSIYPVPEQEKVLPSIRNSTKGQSAELAKAKDRKALYWKKSAAAKDVKTLVSFYEELMFPIHETRDTIYHTWVERCALFSKIKNTKNAKAEDKAQWEKDHASMGDEIDALKAKQAAYVADTFDTAIYNDFLSTLAKNIVEPGVHSTAVTTFHDMTDNLVTFDEKTQILLKFVMFGDSEHQNSDLLFSCIEYPERGAHTFAKGESLEAVSQRVMETVGSRHALPMKSVDEVQYDAGFLLRPKQTEEAEAISA